MKQKLFYLLLIFTFAFNVNYSQVMLAGWSGLESTSTASYPRSSNYVISGHGVTATESYSGLVLRDDSRYFFGSMNSSTTLNTSTAPYVEYQINLNSTKKIDFDRFVLYAFDHREGKAQLRWSVDNYATSLGEFSTYAGYSLTSRDLDVLPDFIGTSVTFRVYFYNATGALLVNGQPYGRTVAITSTSINPYTSYDSTPSTYHSSWKNVGIYINSIETPVQNITIVASGGAAEGSGWSYSNGVISPNTNYDVNINSSDIVSKLSQGNLTVQSTNASITISSSITSSNSNSLTFKAAGNILQNAGAKVTTNGGDITYWSDSDNSGQGAIVVGSSNANGGEEIKSNGGNILLAGGTDVNSGFAKGAVGFLPWSTKPYGGVSLFHASINAKNSSSSSGGNIVIRGSLSNVLGSVSGRAALVTNSNVLTQGAGTISVEGDCTNFAGSNPWGVIIEGYTLIEASDGLISITGTGSTAAANARGISFSGGTLTSQRPFVNSKNGGEIVFTDKTNSSSANFTGTYFNMGYIGQTQNVADSYYGSGIVRIISDKMQFDGGTVRDNFTQLNTNGEIYLLPYTNSFKASATDTTIPQIFEKLAFGNPSIVQIGKSTNTSKVRIGNNSTDISFNSGYQMDIYSGGIEFYKYINADKLRLFSSSGVTQTQPIAANHLEIYGSGATSLANTSNYIKKLTAGTTSVPVGNLTLYTNEDLLISNSDSSGLIGINSTGYITLRTYSGKNINIDRNIKTTYTGSIALSLYADFGLAANNACNATATGGSINFVRSSANIEIPASARARLFSSAPSNSALLSNKAVDGVYYRANTNTATITTPNTGIQALYRADNVVPIGGLSAISGDRNLTSDATEATYSVLPVSGATSYVWNLPAGMTITSSTGIEIQVSISSSFVGGNITVKAVNTCSESSVRSLSVSRQTSPLSITGASSICIAEGSVTESYSVPSVEGATSYVWTVPSGSTISSGINTNTISVTYNSSFTRGTIRVSATGANGVISSGSLTVSGIAMPGAIVGTTQICSGGTFDYSITAVDGATSYEWILPSGMTIQGAATGTSITVSASSSVSGTLSVRALSPCGSSQPRTLSISGVPTPGYIYGERIICGATSNSVDVNGNVTTTPQNGIYTYNILPVTGADSYTWSLPTGVTLVSGQGTRSIQVSFASGFVSGSITVVANSASCGTSPSRAVAVSSAIASIGGPTNICGLTTATYSVSAGVGSNYVWTLPEGMSISSGAGTNSITVSINHPINFSNNNNTVSLSFTTPCGGSKEVSLTVDCPDYSNLTNCGSTVAFNERVYTRSVSGATMYAFDIYDSTSSTLLTTYETRGNFFQFVQALSSFEFGTTYNVKVRVKRNGVYGIAGSVCSITLTTPVTAIQTSQCNQTVTTEDRVFATSVWNGVTYAFDIYDSEGNLITTLEKTSNFFRMREFASVYGMTYQVGVRVKRGNGSYGEQGSRCNVTIAIPTTSLVATQCGVTINIADRIYARSVANATMYAFRIYDANGAFITELERPFSFFRITDIAYTIGTSYKVGVKVKQGESSYGLEGALCTITLSGPPTTSIANAQCGTSILYTDAIYATAVTNATGYKFNVYDVTGTTLVASYESVTNSFSFSQLTGYAFDTTYQVRVQVIRGTEYGVEGTACSITVLKDAPARALSNQDEIKSSIISEFKAYPNPFTTTFSITPMEGETATLFYQVYDVTGKMIESHSVEANEITNHTIGEQYPAGMYLVIVRQGATTQTLKMVKQ